MHLANKFLSLSPTKEMLVGGARRRETATRISRSFHCHRSRQLILTLPDSTHRTSLSRFRVMIDVQKLSFPWNVWHRLDVMSTASTPQSPHQAQRYWEHTLSPLTFLSLHLQQRPIFFCVHLFSAWHFFTYIKESITYNSVYLNLVCVKNVV